MATSTVRPLKSPQSTERSSLAPLGLLSGLFVALVVVAILAFQILHWDKITPGVVVMGTDVGGMSRSDAEAELAPKVESILNRPLQLHFSGRVWDTTAKGLGVSLDPRESVNEAYAVGRSGNPVQRLLEQARALARGHAVTLSSTTDRAALESSLASIAREVERPARDASLMLGGDGTVRHVTAEMGLAVDIAASRENVVAALSSGARVADLAVRETQPSIGNDLVQPAREKLDRILGGGGPEAPLTLTFEREQWTLERPEVVKILSVAGGTRPGEPASVKIDEAPLIALAEQIADQVEQDVREARFAWNGGNLKPLVESRDGRKLDVTTTVDLIKSKLLSGERAAELPVEVTRAKVSSEDPSALGIVEVIDRGSTSFAGSVPEKIHNISLAAERLNGVVVPPGGTFSFNKEVGPTTLAAGFKWGFGITSGEDGVRTVPSVAGGICQVATTLFQPVFWSGFALEERYPHLYWIPGYASRGVVGLDITVDADANLDFKWINPTDDYVLIQSAVDETHLYFGLYGKKPDWRVEVDDAVITNRVPADPKPVAQAEPNLPWGKIIPVETAREGFDVVINRRVYSPGNTEPRPLTLRTSYQPSRTVSLVGTGGKPADAKVEDALNQALAAYFTPTPVRTAGPASTATPAANTNATPNAAGGATPTAPSRPQTAPTSVPATPTQQPASNPPQPTATPVAQAPSSPLSAPTPAPKPKNEASEKPGGASAPVPTGSP